MIEAKIILDSVSPEGKRITTFSLEYPRFIHSELMTHRVFSRNASSSRAIPVTKMIERIRKQPALPTHWGKNQKGMQADEELGLTAKAVCQGLALKGLNQMIELVEAMLVMGLHKQVANRYLEPWMHIAVVLTSTQPGLNNWYNLRYHKAAQPEIKALAQQMYEAQKRSSPQKLEYGEWHLPYVDVNAERDLTNLEGLKKVSAARCARVSYLTHEGNKPTLAEDLRLYDRLMGGVPKHASPTEHQATPARGDHPLQGNFEGWIQYRKLIPEEYLPDFQGPIE